MSPVPMNAKTTLISQAKNDFDALISVQSVLDLETDFSAEMLAPADLFNLLFYYRSESTVDADDELPDLEFAMDPEAWSNFLKLEVGEQLFGEVDANQDPVTYFLPKFGTVPFSEGDLKSGWFNKTPQGAQPTVTNDDQVGTHYAYWIMSILFGANGIGFTANFEQLVGSVVNKNGSFNKSLKRLVNLNGGHLPTNDINRLGANPRYQTPASEGTDPREGGRVTTAQGLYSNNPGQQVISSMAEDNRDETVRRLLESLKKVSYPLRRDAAIAENNDNSKFEDDGNGNLVEPVTGIPQIPSALMNILDLNGFNDPDIFTHFLAPDNTASGNSGLQSYYGKWNLSDDDWTASGLEGEKPTEFRIPELVYNKFSSSGWNTTNFVPLTEWIDGDTFSMLLALASVNQAVVNTSVLNSGQDPSSGGIKFVPNLSTRGLYQSKNGFFTQTTNPEVAALNYQTSQGGGVGTSHPGGLYDKEVQITSGLLGWHLASMKIKLSNKLSQEQCALLAAWAKIMAIISYLNDNNLKNKDPTGESDEEKNRIAHAKSLLSLENWRATSDAGVASQYIEMELSRTYQSLFRDIVRECERAENPPQEDIDSGYTAPSWYSVLVSDSATNKEKIKEIADYYLEKRHLAVDDLESLTNGLDSSTLGVVSDARKLVTFLNP